MFVTNLAPCQARGSEVLMMTSLDFRLLEFLLEAARHVVDRRLLHGHPMDWWPVLLQIQYNLVDQSQELSEVFFGIEVVLLVFVSGGRVIIFKLNYLYGIIPT